METIRINNYSFEKPLTSDNSGFSKWGIGTRGGQKYFVKEFLSPVYPTEDAPFTQKKREERIRLCQTFVEGKSKLYSAIRDASDGHVIAIEQFFRVGSKFYISTKAITDPVMSISAIAKCSFLNRIRLCCSIAHAMAEIHKKKIVHADIKPDNIMVVCKGGLCPNIIDFDCSFFESESPKLGEELNGDLVYLSPEAYLHIAEIESNLSCKMDVFALGVLFHQYFTGKLPNFDHQSFCYPGEAVANGAPLTLAKGLPRALAELLESMLAPNPQDRPAAAEVFEALYMGPDGPGRFIGSGEAAKAYSGASSATAGGRRWSQAGDL